jgi:hypothetical protein
MVWRMRWWAITGRVRRVAPAAAIGKSENQARAAPDVSRPERLAEGHE